MNPDDSAGDNARHDRNGIDSEPTSSGYLAGILDRLVGRDDVTAFFADGGETFALEGAGEREWLTADADSVMEVRP